MPLKTLGRGALIMLIALLSSAARAADAELDALRAEIRQLRESYEQRLNALEQRLLQAAATPAPPATPATPTAAPVSAAAFNPALSLTLSGSYTRFSADPKRARIDGFFPAGHETPARGFNLGESELGLTANVDTLFRGALNFSLARDNSASVEEAYVETLDLGRGFTLKLGRALSGIGYLNGQHAHVWNFADAPLAYQAFLGGQWHFEGAQMKWLAPTERYLEFGAELGRGGEFPSTDNGSNGATAAALFAHSGGDFDASHSWRAGLSWLTTSPRQRGDEFKFSGSSRLWVVDGVWKWAPQGNSREQNWVAQAEYFRRAEVGELTCSSDCTTSISGAYRSAQSGLYAQAAWQFMPAWRVGYRYDRLDYGTVAMNGAGLVEPPQLATFSPSRHSVMLDWSPSEFSRLRLQFARDQSRRDATDRQIWLQYVMSLGSHPAHIF